MNARSKVVLITGGTNGLGLATSQLLLQRGWTVFVSSRTPKAAPPGREIVTLDVADSRSVAAAVNTVIERAGRLDALVNNASYGLLIGAVEETPVEDAQAVFETNLFGIMRLTNAVLPIFRAQGGGRIINMSSAAGFLGFPFHTFYSASKWAVEGFTESLRYEVAQQGIQVSMIEPDIIAKDPEGTLHPVDAHLPIYATDRATTVKKFDEMSKRGVKPAEVARTIAKVLEDPHPKLRYRVGIGAKRVRLLKSFMPEGLFERASRKQYGLDSRGRPAAVLRSGESPDSSSRS